MKYFEDISVGERIRESAATPSQADEIKAFATRFDPQPFHVDERRPRTLAFRRALRVRLAHRRGLDAADGRLSPRRGRAARARGEPVAAMGPALGFRELKWLKPVYVGDTIDYTSEVIEARVSEQPARLRPDDAFAPPAINQNGEPVISFISTTFVERRPVTP